MYKARHLTLCDHEMLTTFTGGVVGDVIDLGAKNRAGEGYPFYFILASGVEMTATGDPLVNIDLESADDELFASPQTSRMFTRLKKADFSPSAPSLAQPCPFRLKRYVR